MDKDAERQKLEDAQAFIMAWFDHPITRELLQENKEQEAALVSTITDRPVEGLMSMAALVEAKGELRGVRRWRGLVEEKLNEIKEKLKELE